MNSWFLVILIVNSTSFTIKFDSLESCRQYKMEHKEQLKMEFPKAKLSCTEGMIKKGKLILFSNYDEWI